MRAFDSNAVYQSRKDYMSSSRIKKYDISPLHFRYFEDNPEVREPGNHLDFGSADHIMTFEPFKHSEIIILTKPNPDKTFADKENKQEKQRCVELSLATGRPMITDDEFKEIENMVDALNEDPFIRAVLQEKSGAAERSYYVDYPLNFDGETKTVKMRVRPDWETDYAIYDLKSTTDASPYGFSKAINEYLYHVSAAMYCECVAIETKVKKPFIWIAQEKKAPYAAGLYLCSHEDMNAGMLKLQQLLINHVMCTENNYWPGYTSYGVFEKGGKFNGVYPMKLRWSKEALSFGIESNPEWFKIQKIN